MIALIWSWNKLKFINLELAGGRDFPWRMSRHSCAIVGNATVYMYVTVLFKEVNVSILKKCSTHLLCIYISHIYQINRPNVVLYCATGVIHISTKRCHKYYVLLDKIPVSEINCWKDKHFIKVYFGPRVFLTLRLN